MTLEAMVGGGFAILIMVVYHYLSEILQKLKDIDDNVMQTMAHMNVDGDLED